MIPFCTVPPCILTALGGPRAKQGNQRTKKLAACTEGAADQEEEVCSALEALASDIDSGVEVEKKNKEGRRRLMGSGEWEGWVTAGPIKSREQRSERNKLAAYTLRKGA